MSAVSRGNAAERYVAKWLQDRGWLVASRRHIGGAGDLLAVWPHTTHSQFPLDGEISGKREKLVEPGEVLLIEVKDRKNPYEGFRREDRAAMRTTPLPLPGGRWLCNKRGKELIWTAEFTWP